MKKIIVFVLAGVLAGCATAKVENLSNTSYKSPVIQAQQKVFVALPQDGTYENKKYEYSGKQVQQNFFDEISRYANEAVLADRVLSAQQARQVAWNQRAEVFVYPIITSWEDRNTAYSTMRDKIKINVSVYETRTGALLDRTSLYATGGSIQWFGWGNPSPSRLLNKVIRPYVKKLYHK